MAVKAFSRKCFANWQNRTRVHAGKGGRGRDAHRPDLGHVGPQGLVELTARGLAPLGACRVTAAGTFKTASVIGAQGRLDDPPGRV